MEDILQFISPELVVLVPVLYLIGIGLKKATIVADKFIPLILGGVGILLACLWVLGNNGFSVTGLFTAITQGILVAGGSVYCNQLIKQLAGK